MLLTFSTTLVVTTRPGMTGALREGMLASMAWIGSFPTSKRWSGSSAIVSPGVDRGGHHDPAAAHVEGVRRGGLVLLQDVGGRRGHEGGLDLSGGPVVVGGVEEQGGAGDVRGRHRGAGDGLEVLARRSAGDLVGGGRVPGEDLDARRGDVGLDPEATGATGREGRHHVADRFTGHAGGERSGLAGVAVEERDELRAVGEVDHGEEVVVGLDVGRASGCRG